MMALRSVVACHSGTARSAGPGIHILQRWIMDSGFALRSRPGMTRLVTPLPTGEREHVLASRQSNAEQDDPYRVH